MLQHCNAGIAGDTDRLMIYAYCHCVYRTITIAGEVLAFLTDWPSGQLIICNWTAFLASTLASLLSVYCTPSHMAYAREFICDTPIDILPPLMHVNSCGYVAYIWYLNNVL